MTEMHNGEQSPYKLPYDEQPDDTWMKCPWADDPEVAEGKKGRFAKKCPCPNCVYHTYVDELPTQRGRFKKFLVWIFGESEFCRTCGHYNNCTSTNAECGSRGRVTGIRVTDDDIVVADFDEGTREDTEP